MVIRIQDVWSIQLREGMTSLLLAALLLVTGQVCATPVTAPPANAATQTPVSSNYGKLPLSFEINRGQTSSQVKFLARGQGYSVFLTPREAVLSLRAAQADTPPRAKARKPATSKGRDKGARSAVVRMRLAHSNSSSVISGLDPMPGKSNYFIGNDPDRWQREVEHYARVKYAAVYPGIDLVYHGNQRQLEYDFVLAPGADPKRIELVFDGTRGLSLDKHGNLILATAKSDLVQHKPVVYQDVGGVRTEVEGRYVLRGRNRAGFRLANYNTRQPLVIDPVLSYSTYLGGSGTDYSYAIAVDGSGNAYVTGRTSSSNFPTSSGAYQRSYGGGGNDIFVTKFNATGTALIYSTFLGGSDFDDSASIAVDASGNAYITGATGSSNFPTTTGAYRRFYGGGGDAYVAKLNAAGSALVYSTYLGGSGREWGNSIAVDAIGIAYVSGHTASSDFPTTAGAYQIVFGGGRYDAFVTKLNFSGSALVYSTYLGGSGDDGGASIAVDASGNAYVTGPTGSSNFPTTAGAYQRFFSGDSNIAFIAKFNAAGSTLVYSTYLGGSGNDGGDSIVVDAIGNAYVSGFTTSSNFPTTAGAYQRFYGGGGNDGFVTKLNATGTALVYSTFLGGSSVEECMSIAVDSSGNTYVAGVTGSSNFPTTAGAFQRLHGGGSDAFVAKFNAAGTALVYSTFLGDSGSDWGVSIAVDANGNAYVSGFTTSSNFPTTTGAYQIFYGGRSNDVSSGGDAFIAKFSGLSTPISGQVVEYLNTADFPNSPGGHFFYSSNPAEQAAVDAGSAGAFFRTGRNFMIGGSSPVCRFYGSVAPGPNSHFFTVDVNECNALRAAQITPTPTNVQQWNYEGVGYNTTQATIAANGIRSCPANTLPLYRAYNNAYPVSGPKNPWDSNHRFTPAQADIVAMVAKGWRDEGIVFCTAP